MNRKIANGRTIAIFGEDENDRVAVQELLLALRPDVKRGETLLLRKPLTLVKNLDEAKRKARGDKVVEVLRVANVRNPLRAAIFHEDADAVEPAHIRLIGEIKRTYAAAPCLVLAAVPAWEMESWWFQFPEAVSAVNGQWRSPDQYTGRNVGLIVRAKERLQQCVRPNGVRRGSRFREYEESDSPDVAKNIIAMNLLNALKADSASWKAFVEEIRSLPPVAPRGSTTPGAAKRRVVHAPG